MALIETNLSKKDKITIAIVLFVGVMFCFAWYLIKPAIADIRTLTDEIEQAENTQQLYRNKIINLSSAESVFNMAVTDLYDSTSGFYGDMTSSEVDRMITTYLLGRGLFPEELYITMPTGPVEEVPYLYSEAFHSLVNNVATTVQQDEDIMGEQDTDSDEESSDSANPLQSTVVDSLFVPYNQAKSEAVSTSYSGVECADVTIVVNGDEATCQALIDDICTNPSIRIRGFEWLEVQRIQQYNEETETTEYVTPDYRRLRMDLRIYMADVADYEAMVNEAVESVGAEG